MHVAWVSAVNGDTVEIEEYNYGVRYTYGRRVIPKMPLAATFILKPRAGTTNSQPALAPSGTYTFTSQLAIKSQASLSSPTLDYYYAGESVRYDKVLEDDGQRWISYISYSGARRYIAIQPTITQSTNNSLPASGSYTIQSYSSVRNNPSLSSPEITFYGAGSVVRYDKVITAEGRTWISYISYSGARRYIAIS